MSCNSCAKPYTLLRKEKGCPSCGFSYCSKCLDNKVFVKKLNSEAKVCAKCKKSTETTEAQKIEPPAAYYKRLGLIPNDSSNPQQTTGEAHPKDQEILNRLMQLKEDSKKATVGSSEAEIATRLKKIKGEMPSTSDAELQERLAKLRGVPVSTLQSKPVLLTPDIRTEQEQANDLLKQYMEQTKIDGTYKDEFDGLVNDIESRLGKLKGASSTKIDKTIEDAESEDEDETVRKILEKVKAEASLDIDQFPATNDELPFCEICNEDATMRCLGCRYLFCKRCYLEHRDDDECNRYEPYSPPKGSLH